AGIGKTRLLGEFARRGRLLGLDVRWIDDVSDSPSRSASAAPHVEDAEGSCGLSVVRSLSDDDPTTPTRLVLVDLSAGLDRLDEVRAVACEDEPPRPTIVVLAADPTVGPAPSSAHRVLAALARQRILHDVEVPPLDQAELFELASHILGGPPHARLH